MRNKQSGYTLVELIVVAFIILTGIVGITALVALGIVGGHYINKFW